MRLAVLFLVLAIVAAVLGFGGLVASAADIARILFFLFLVLSLLILAFRQQSPNP